MFGDLKHQWQKLLDQSAASAVESSGIQPDHWRMAGRKSKSNPGRENLEWWREGGVDHLERYADWLSSTPLIFASFDGEPAIEFAWKAEMGGTLVRGFIDQVMVDPDTGDLIVIDVKTGARTPDSDLQLGIYASAVELLGYPRPKWGAFYMSRTGGLTDLVSLDRYSIQYLDQLFSQFRLAVTNNIFIPHVSNMCKGCSVRDACYSVGGLNSWQYDPLNPLFKASQDAVTSKEGTA